MHTSPLTRNRKAKDSGTALRRHSSAGEDPVVFRLPAGRKQRAPQSVPRGASSGAPFPPVSEPSRPHVRLSDDSNVMPQVGRDLSSSSTASTASLPTPARGNGKTWPAPFGLSLGPGRGSNQSTPPASLPKTTSPHALPRPESTDDQKDGSSVVVGPAQPYRRGDGSRFGGFASTQSAPTPAWEDNGRHFQSPAREPPWGKIEYLGVNAKGQGHAARRAAHGTPPGEKSLLPLPQRRSEPSPPPSRPHN